MSIILMLIATLALALQSIWLKLFNLKYKRSTAGQLLFNGLYCLFAAGFSAATAGALQVPHPLTWILGGLFGILFAMTTFLLLKLLETGPLSLGNLFVNMSLLIPVLYSVVFLKEGLNLMKITGIALILVTFAISSGVGKEKSQSISLKWLMLALLTLTGNGLLGTLQKIHQHQLPGQDVSELVLIGYGFAAFTSAFLLIVVRRIQNTGASVPADSELIPSGQKAAAQPKSHKSRIFIPVTGLILATAACSVTGNKLIVSLSSTLDGSILFPVINGGIVVLTTLMSILFFREKPVLRTGFSLLTGIAAILLLGM